MCVFVCCVYYKWKCGRFGTKEIYMWRENSVALEICSKKDVYICMSLLQFSEVLFSHHRDRLLAMLARFQNLPLLGTIVGTYPWSVAFLSV